MDDAAPDPELPPDLEEQASELLLGPPDLLAPRYEALCAAHEPWRPALLRLRADFQRAARLLRETGDQAPAALPSAIGPYRILRQIGEGAFGVVYLAEQQQPIRREVAIKLLHTAASSPGTLARFLNERETLARMSHPAIARIFDAGVDGHGRPYFVMEYVAGEPLHRFVATRAASLTARLELFLAACEGVNHAHQRGVIHRDLKPHNILVADVDGKWLPKVIDFGLAKVVEPDVAEPVRTHAGALLGTPAYMSPEQLRGDAHDADTRTDVYALGVILHELLTTTLPVAPEVYRGKGLAELERAVLAHEPPLASVRAAEAGMAYARQLRGDLDWILRKAMARREAERYPTVAAFAADLRHHLADEPVSAGPPSTVYQLRKFVRRHRGAVLAAAVVVVTIVLGLVISAVAWRRADDNARQAQQRLADFWRLADVIELEDLVAAEAALWPSSPERLADHETWLRRADGLVQRRPRHEATLAALRARLAAGPALPDEEARGARFLVASLERHLAGLATFTAPDGPHHAVARRAAFARTVQHDSIDAPRAAWDRAIAAVAASPHYGGLQLTPILGLVPLGTDLDSGFEEFAHLQSGRVPVRDASGALVLGEDTAIVLVLIPGGDTQVGSQKDDPNEPNHDPGHEAEEEELAVARLQPYLIGKYELTQGQVRALGMPSTSLGRMGTQQPPSPPFTGRHPEESVTAPLLTQWLPRFGLRLPNGYEWEVAARAGNGTVWGVGDHVADLQGHANLADATLGALRPTGVATEPSLRDGFLSTAPVGSFRPNAFGLHDMIGNVAELTTAIGHDGSTLHLARGGSYMVTPHEARIAAFNFVLGALTTTERGARVCRSL